MMGNDEVESLPPRLAPARRLTFLAWVMVLMCVNALLVAPDAMANSAAIRAHLVALTQTDAMDLASALKPEITARQLELETRDRRIIIRLLEQPSFPGGSATLRPAILPVVEKVRDRIKDLPGEIAVEGHADDVPVSTARFRSNWELAASRAVAVAHELMRDGVIAPARLVVKSYGDTRPLAPNTTHENRARNRRVEIVIDQGGDDAQYLSGEKPLPAKPVFPLGH